MPIPQALTWKDAPAHRSALSLRERFRRTMHFEPVDRVPDFEFGYWDETLPAWHAQGLPASVNNELEACAYFGIERWVCPPVNMGVCPSFERQVIETAGDYAIVRDRHGALVKELREGVHSIPHYIEYAVKDRASWEALKQRLNPDEPARFPSDWAEVREAYRRCEQVRYVDMGSMLGWPRNWTGFENIGVLAYDDPEMFEDMIETLCRTVCAVLEKLLPQLPFDAAIGWEDICFKNGPLISPAMFERFIVPRYQRITALLRRHRIDVIMTDCDGNILPILRQFLDGGVNCMFPIEVAAGSDPVAMRERYGRRLLLHGGVDKMPLIKGGRAIEKELLRLKPVVDDGGFIPHVDHRCPSDVTLENYTLYRRLKREIFNAGDLASHAENGA